MPHAARETSLRPPCFNSTSAAVPDAPTQHEAVVLDVSFRDSAVWFGDHHRGIVILSPAGCRLLQIQCAGLMGTRQNPDGLKLPAPWPAPYGSPVRGATPVQIR